MVSASPGNSMHNHGYQQEIFATLPPCSDVLPHRYYNQSASARTRSISSSVISAQATHMGHPYIKNPLSVQPISTNAHKPTRKPCALPSHFYDRNNNQPFNYNVRMSEDSMHDASAAMHNPLGWPNGALCFDHLPNPNMFSNLASMQHHHEERLRKTLSADETAKYYHHDRSVRDEHHTFDSDRQR